MQRPLLLALALLACACHPEHAPADDPLAGAKALIVSKDYSAAIEKLEALRTQGGDDPQVASLLMELYEQQNDPARAILRGRSALALHPDAKALYIPLSRLYTHAKQYQTSKELLLDARKAGVDEKDVAFQLGTCLAYLDDIAGARAEYARALAAGYPEAEVQYNLGLLAVREQDRAGARAIFAAIVAKKPDYLPAQRELAHVILDQAILDAQKTGKVDQDVVKKLMSTLWDLKDKMKTDWRVNESLGDGWFLLGDYDAALVSYTDALRLGQNPASVEARFREAATRKKDLAALRAKAPPADGASSTPK
jgi:tetratricopeptide (TPR) repeat protein